MLNRPIFSRSIFVFVPQVKCGGAVIHSCPQFPPLLLTLRHLSLNSAPCSSLLFTAILYSVDLHALLVDLWCGSPRVYIHLRACHFLVVPTASIAALRVTDRTSLYFFVSTFERVLREMPDIMQNPLKCATGFSLTQHLSVSCILRERERSCTGLSWLSFVVTL